MTTGSRPRLHLRTAPGFALVMVLLLGVIGFSALMGIMSWSSNSSRTTDRNNQYFTTAAAAEAATEKVLAHMLADYQSEGAALIAANVAGYTHLVPTAAEWGPWANLVFSDAQGHSGQTYIQRISSWAYTNLQSQYQGLYGLASTYRVVSNARLASGLYDVTAGVRQDLQLATIPVFQFAIFYSVELEINPGPAMTVSGRVHSNADLYACPNTSLTFMNDVTAVGRILRARDPNDPNVAGSGPLSFLGEHDGGVGSLTLPIGTNNTPEAVFSVIDVPPAGESALSAMGQQRFYNKADLVVLVSNSTVTATSGAFNSFATTIPWAQASSFLTTNASFFNKRENKQIIATEIDVAKLISWSATNTVLRPLLGSRDVSAIYVADQRTLGATNQSAVRLVNGQTLPSRGLTVATKNPLYVKGHYNAPAAHLGTTNTTLTLPAALVGDAINILSGAWDDSKGALGLSSRTASSTTVNAAFLAGIVPTGLYGGVKRYSGGVENFPRFLEDWGSAIFTYNGSMVVMFYSHIAAAPWLGTGSSYGIYNPPTRRWAFDLNFLNSAKLPPGTPQLRTLIRGEWALVRPNTVD